MILASDVYHSTRYLEDAVTHTRTLLKPGGVLMLGETFQSNAFLEATRGWTEPALSPVSLLDPEPQQRRRWQMAHFFLPMFSILLTASWQLSPTTKKIGTTRCEIVAHDWFAAHRDWVSTRHLLLTPFASVTTVLPPGPPKLSPLCTTCLLPSCSVTCTPLVLMNPCERKEPGLDPMEPDDP